MALINRDKRISVLEKKLQETTNLLSKQIQVTDKLQEDLFIAKGMT